MAIAQIVWLPARRCTDQIAAAGALQRSDGGARPLLPAGKVSCGKQRRLCGQIITRQQIKVVIVPPRRRNRICLVRDELPKKRLFVGLAAPPAPIPSLDGGHRAPHVSDFR